MAFFDKPHLLILSNGDSQPNSHTYKPAMEKTSWSVYLTPSSLIMTSLRVPVKQAKHNSGNSTATNDQSMEVS